MGRGRDLTKSKIDPSSVPDIAADCRLFGEIISVDMTVPKRQSKRTPIFLRGTLELEDSIQDVRIRNVSVDGALVDVSDDIGTFQTATLVCGLSRINGIVVWSEDGQAGIEFAEPISGKTLTDSVQTKLRVSAPKQYREGEIADNSD
jgi:hypothetical protein